VEPLKPGDTLAFRFGDLFPPEDPLSEWLLLLAMALNDLALVHDRLARDQESLHEWFYWMRLGVAHFFEAAKLLKRGRDRPEVVAYVATLPNEVRGHHDRAISIYDERFLELKMTRDVLFHYARVWRRSGEDPEPVVLLALQAVTDELVTLQTGTLRTARSLFADDVAVAIFTRATGIQWEAVTKEDSQLHVGRVQERIAEAVEAFVRFANPALMEHFGRAMTQDKTVRRVEPVDPDDPRAGWSFVE
jgi:hypothetical protein